jgi:hypothetical protein
MVKSSLPPGAAGTGRGAIGWGPVVGRGYPGGFVPTAPKGEGCGGIEPIPGWTAGIAGWLGRFAIGAA